MDFTWKTFSQGARVVNFSIFDDAFAAFAVIGQVLGSALGPISSISTDDPISPENLCKILQDKLGAIDKTPENAPRMFAST